ncbi:hypothetical protein CEXT_91531 [Caerostris extrusa]|uniref:Uncharacterized protein n=1 Tax=Caerostris extrusa TaxID=172846 RepID=A0AAV4VID3_CAEEX|nr:hypothetical protein CEXT_91531 [Caerostris extrusa]
MSDALGVGILCFNGKPFYRRWLYSRVFTLESFEQGDANSRSIAQANKLGIERLLRGSPIIKAAGLPKLCIRLLDVRKRDSMHYSCAMTEMEFAQGLGCVIRERYSD